MEALLRREEQVSEAFSTKVILTDSRLARYTEGRFTSGREFEVELFITISKIKDKKVNIGHIN